MHLTVTSNDNVFPLEVPPDLELRDFKAFCEAQSGIPSKEIVILFNGRNLDDENKSLDAYGIKNGDMVYLQRKKKSGGGSGMPDFSQIRLPGASPVAVTTRSPSPIVKV